MSNDELTAQQQAAHERSKAVWDQMAHGWYARREEFWAFSRPVAEWLVEKLNPRAGHIVLELAAGLGETGFLAAKLMGGTGRLISTDFALEMVDLARRRAQEMGVTSVEFRALDAQRMDLETHSVDGVICRWGYMLMVDPATAFAETRRVLRPSGRLVFSVWAAPDRNPWASLVSRILMTKGHMPAPAPNTPGIFALADPNRIRHLVSAAGFTEPEIQEMVLQWRFADQEAYWRFLLEVAGAISPILRGLTPDAQTAVRQQVHEAARPFYEGAGYNFPAAVLNVGTS